MIFEDIKLVVIDIDGTLLDTERILQPETRQAIEAVRKMGITVSLASGRTFVSASRIAQELHLDAPIITHNGAYIGRVQDKVPLVEAPIEMHMARDMLGMLEELGSYLKVYIGDELFVETVTGETVEFSEYHGVAYHAVGKGQLSRLGQNPHKITVIDESDRIKEIFQHLQPWNRHFNICRDSDQGIEIVRGNVNKGSALGQVCSILGIAKENVMAFGNEGNDLEMVSEVGVGIAMGNAYPGLKKAAKIITKSNDELGVAYVLNKYLLGQEI